MQKIQLILIDDHVLFTDGLSSALTKEEDFEISATFSNAQKVLDHLQHTTLPDLIITDISMPEMNGLEFIQKVKTQHPSLKILVVSMFEQMCSSKNIDGYLSKNATISEFSKAIRTIVLEDQKYFKAATSEHVVAEFNTHILTKREKQIAQLITNELTVDEIAEQLFISRLTVESHKKNIFFKLNVHTNAGLVKKAIQLGFF